MRLVLAFFTLLSVTTWRTGDCFANVNCVCYRWSTSKPRIENIEKYTEQTKRLCSIHAIVLHTKANKKICVDPGKDWVKNVIDKIDAKRIKKDEVKGTEGSAITDGPAIKD
ncbi:hypothetical protein UPYG_G00294550 [Umbra pygmaea]|uniref:Chemokine interleukin-8-like domain-containing protein n=1 Tax=Umbra pygmaea TaxID=75934 RepID=A0ABD0W5E2_UMBPY